MQKLFISYARVDGLESAERLRDHLAEAGHDVWMDDQLHPGGWDAQLEREIRECDCVLLVVTEDVERGDGFCRREVQYALECTPTKTIVPLICEEGARPPIQVTTHQRVYFHGRHDEALEELLMLLGRLGQGSGLELIDFADDLARLREGFVGRDWWLGDRIDAWLSDSPKQAMAIIGEPGIGKSAIAAWLTEARDERIAAIYLCSTGIPGSIEPHRFVDTVVAQLGARLPEYARLVPVLEGGQRPPKAADASCELVVRVPTAPAVEI